MTKTGTIRIDDEGNRYIVTSKNYKIFASDIWSKETPVIFAEKVLKTDSTATEAATKSPYVKYNGIDCRVLYNDETHGLQIITANSVKDVTLGYGDETVTASDFTYDGSATVDDNFKKAAASYNNAVDTLNNIAKTYKDTKGVATDARCLGSNPILKEGVFQNDASSMWTGYNDYLNTYSWNNKFKTFDPNYSEEDVTQLNALGVNVTSGNIWLASRRLYSYSSYTDFCVKKVYFSGNISDDILCRVSSIGRGYIPSNGFRPVFLLSSDVVISGGDGSSENPYVIE